MMIRLLKVKLLKHPIIILFAIAVIALCIGLGWLSLMIIVLIGFYSLKYTNWRVLRFLRKHAIISYPLMFLGVILFAVWMRVFVFEIFVVPSSSMEDTILPGDKVIVSKLNYGPKLPRTPFEIPWINLFFYLNPKTKSLSDSIWWDYKRLSGFSKYNNGDIMVFSPYGGKQAFIKRCIALPGDTLEIHDSNVIINSKAFEEPPTVKWQHTVWYNDIKKIKDSLDGVKMRDYNNGSRGQGSFGISLNKDKASKLSGLSSVDSIRVKSIPTDSVPRAFPYYPNPNQILWSADFFGPFMIPKKGLTISINTRNFILYQRLINTYESSDIKLISKNDKFYLNELEIENYTFKKNYFFMMGDHRHDSNDSRYWGPVPEENILGKASFILFSNDYAGFKWNRILKNLK